MISTERYVVQLEKELMIIEAKEMSPILISVPHDGLPSHNFSGFFKARKNGYKGEDRYIWPVAKDILLSANANAIRGLMPRSLIDYNRGWPNGIDYCPLRRKEVHTALDDEKLLPAYEHYHASIDRILVVSAARFGKEKVLLIDFHGFSKQPPYAPPGGYDLILGTGNRASIFHGDVDRKLAWFMRNRGYCVFLPEETSIGDGEDWYSGGFTIRHHSEKHWVNTIQIEIASRFRRRETQKVGQKLSTDLSEFLNNNCM